MIRNEKKWEAAVGKELQDIRKREEKLEKAALSAKPAQWHAALEEKIPPKVCQGLEVAFCKGFSVVFQQGQKVIEKTYKKEELQVQHAIRDYAVQLGGGRRELRQMRHSASRSDTLNFALTTAEGIALGIFGVGMPDIALFLGTLLKGVYESALAYGFDYAQRPEQLLILKMLAASLSTGADWQRRNREVDELIVSMPERVEEETFQAQVQETASVFSMDMLVLKFIQGIPVVGLVGGAANPVYYTKAMRYVQLKYRKRYLMKKKNTVV